MKDQVRTPLRTVLRNFLNHIEKLESSTCPEKSYDAEFQDLKLFSESVKSLKEYACTEGEKETNKKKNRYKDILPFDVSRVILNEYAGIPGSDYINANFIKGASGSPAYIASQGPLPCTVIDFWRMVVQCEVQVIVMACNEEEAGKAKCEKYWVDEGEEKQFGLISVKLLKASTVCPDFSVRTMRLKYTNVQNEMEERTVCQLHYVAWPDHGVPSVVQPLLDMVRLVRDTQASETLPVLVHCSAGCGRTGTICAIDYVWGLLRTGRLTDDFSLLSLIREMRKQRIAMVQTKEQYVLVHQAVRELFKEQLLMIDSHPYENVDPDGLLLIMKEEENHYDTVGNLTKMNLDEKKDNTMEKDVAPPLPQKKQPMYPSKQEKDVENLSAQQRSIMHSSKQKQPLINTVGKSPGLLRTSEVPLQRERPLVQKKISNPIPSKGILRVPHLKNLSSASVKRSKSLKLTNMTAQQKVVVSADIPIEIRRRGSLESNIDEVGSLVGESSYNDSQYEDVTVAKSIGNPSPVYETPRAVQKYDVLKYLQEKRMLVRSLTTFDMRQTTTPQRLPLDAKSAGNNPVKYRLSRSNTQVDFSRLVRNRVADGGVVASNQPSARSVSRNFTSGESQGSLSVFTSTRDGNMSQGLEPENVSGLSKNCPETVNRGDCSTLLHQLRSDYSGRPTDRESFRDYKDGHNFHAEQVTPHRNRVSTHAVNLYDTTRQVSGRYQEAPFPNHDPPSTSRLVHGQKPKPNFMNRHPVYDTYSNAQQIGGRYPKHPSFINGPTGVGSAVYDSRNRHQNDLDKRNGHLPNKEIQGRIQSQLHRKDPLPSPSLVQYQVTDPGPHTSHSETSSSPRKPFEMGNPKVLKKRGNYPTWENEQRRGISCTSPQTLGNKPSNPSADHLFPHSIVGNVWKPSYRLSKQNVDQLLGSPSEEHFRVPTEPIQKNFGHSSPNVDSTTTLELDHHSDYFSNAPGVDLDQVAASITQKDASKTNLMKVALEAFNIKRSRQQARLPDSSPSTSSSSKGSSPSSTMVNPKKKQQHYL